MSRLTYQCPIHGSVTIPDDTIFEDECPLCREESDLLDELYLYNDEEDME